MKKSGWFKRVQTRLRRWFNSVQGLNRDFVAGSKVQRVQSRLTPLVQKVQGHCSGCSN
ncbi:MAG: hypothetical protein PHV28_15715 [Kiritimatiellae bacterium]|nr:hypothetical protein [Kiritimatiellia bacterium]